MNRILKFIDLNSDEDDKKNVLASVQANISFRGANVWILACAIVIASIGLNVNSTAVIIGAMLISPLMGPIIGAGFALGIFDFDLLKKSLKNLLRATLVSLFVSTLYFFVSPFKETQSELLARTSPNIYDVLIAFFGGIVGVIAITRKQKGNPIPGVAIATALMPPLCTAGFGLAVGNLRFFAGAIYLYMINCVFICVSTYLIVKFLKYPRVMTYSEKKERQITYFVWILTVILFVPSIYFAYKLFEDRKFEQKINHYVENEFVSKGHTVIYKNIRQSTKGSQLEIAFLNKKFSNREADDLQERLKIYNLPKTKLVIRQDTTNLKRDILRQIKKENAVVDEKEILIADLRKQIEINQFDNVSLLREAKVLFPELADISISNHPFQSNFQHNIIPVAIYSSRKRFPQAIEEKLMEWIKVRTKKNEIYIFWKEVAVNDKNVNSAMPKQSK